MAIAPDSILGVAVSTVTDKINRLNQMADSYNQQLSSALRVLSGVRVGSVSAPPKLSAPQVKAPSDAVKDAPTFTPARLQMPSAPQNIDINNLLSGLDVGDLGAIPDAPTMTPIVIPDAPGMAAVPLPVRPTVDTAIDLPTAPTLALPEMETLEQLTIPAFEFPQLPTFDDRPPDTSSITVPNVFINWTEPQYQSELLPELQAQVREMMAGSTGLPVPVEDALFARARSRESQEAIRAEQSAVDEWAARGFSMPPGMLAKQTAVIREQERLKAAELNRDVMIESAKWQIESIRFAVQQGIALEQLTQNLYANMANRLFEVAKFQADAQIRVFDAQISLFNAQNSAFATLAQVYRAKLDGALSKLQAYKIAVEGQAAIGQVNQQRVEVYKARLTAVQSNVEVYKAMMQGASVRADVIKNQFDAYRADVQAFAEQVGAEKAKFDAYESRIKGEQAKAGVFEAQTRAYASTVQAVANKGDLKVKAAQIKMEAARTKVAKFSADVEAYKTNVDANMREIMYGTQVFSSQVEAWKAKTSTVIADAEMRSRFADMNTRTNIAYAEMQMSAYQVSLQKAVQEAQIAMEGAKAVGQYTAQLAAGAMSAASVSASIGGRGSASSSDSRSTNYNFGG